MTKTGLFLIAMVFATGRPTAAQVAYATRTVPAPSFPAAIDMPLSIPVERTPQFEPAPMPDADLYAPVPRVDDPKAAQLTPSLFQPKNQYRGDGFTPSSTVQGNQERLLKPTPGISMKVPLN